MTSDPTPDGGAPLGVRLAAEGIGSFVVVVAVLGTLLYTAHFADPDRAWVAGLTTVSAAAAAGIATGLAAHAFGPVSGGHLNPAVTVGLAASGRFPWQEAWRYALAQTVGGLFGSTAVVLVGLFGPRGWLATAQAAGFGANGWGPLSPAGFSGVGAVLAEGLSTVILLLAVLGASRGARASAVAAGLGYGLVFLVLSPIDGGGANPARSLAAAIYGGVLPLTMSAVFVVVPLAAAVVAGLGFRALIQPRLPGPLR